MRALRYGDGQIALGNGHSGHLDIAAHDNNAGAFINHHFGFLVRFDENLFDLGQEGDNIGIMIAVFITARKMSLTVEGSTALAILPR